MTLLYKTSELKINKQHWLVREFVDRDQFPTAQEKIDIGAASWGSDVPQLLWPLCGVLWSSGVALVELLAKMNFSGKRILEIGFTPGVDKLIFVDIAPYEKEARKIS